MCICETIGADYFCGKCCEINTNSHNIDKATLDEFLELTDRQTQVWDQAEEDIQHSAHRQ
mgnify:CR=1 FL=1